MIDWPEDLVRDIAARRSVLFLGAGVSRNSENEHGVHPREWTDFLRHLATQVPDVAQQAEVTQCITDADLLTACELARKYLSAVHIQDGDDQGVFWQRLPACADP